MIWIGRKKEREVLKLSKRHFDKILELTKSFKEYVASYVNCKIDEASRLYEDSIFQLERQADDQKEKILLEVSKGPFHPIDREDVIRLVLTMDDIAANLKSAARKLLYTNPCEIPDDIRNDLLKLTDLSVEMVLKLGEALDALISGSKKVLKLADTVERKEEEIDEFRHDLIAKILSWGDSTKNFSNVIMLKEAIENIENASDKGEDVADLIRAIAITGSL